MYLCLFFFFKQKTAYEMRISDWSSDVCSSDLPAGNRGIYGKVSFKNTAIGILPLDEQLNTWLVGQYRFPLDQWSWEIPEGGGPADIDPVESARRELLEETGLKAENMQELLRMHLSNSVSEDRKSTRLNSSHYCATRIPPSA